MVNDVYWAHKARKRRVSMPRGSAEKSSGVSTPKISSGRTASSAVHQWIGFCWENFHRKPWFLPLIMGETMVFTIKYGGNHAFYH